MTNGKKLLGASIVAFLAVTAGSIALANGTSAREQIVAEETVVVEQPSPPSDQHIIDVQIAALNDFLAEQNRIEAEKVRQEQQSAQAPASTPPAAANYDPGDGSRWDQLAQCESGGNWGYGLVSGTFSGGLMFATSTWLAQGGGEFAPFPYMATREQQIIIAEKTLASGGWGQWPGCSRKLGWM